MKDMLGREEVISAEKALALLLEHLRGKSLPRIRVSIEDALGMISADRIVSPEDLPHFARSTVDGYAVKAADSFGATETMPAYLNLSKEIFMGEGPDFSLVKGEASKIPTGGMLPPGADAVVMFEYVQVLDEKTIEIMRPVSPGENVIQAGEDIRKGETLIGEGRALRAQDLGALAGLGITEIDVCARPRVSIVSTGDEIVPAGATPGPGQVRDINSFILAGMISDCGCVSVKKGIFKDDYEIIKRAIEESMEDSEVVVISGGTSVGTKDVIAKIISDIGFPGVLFHGISLKPGKPMIGGIAGGVPVFGLPGHPAAVSVCFEIFIEPVLKLLSGRKEVRLIKKNRVNAKLAKNVSSTPGREEHIRVVLEKRPDGLWAVPVLGKSGLITTLVKAEGTFIIPLGQNGIEKGEIVEVRLF